MNHNISLNILNDAADALFVQDPFGSTYRIARRNGEARSYPRQGERLYPTAFQYMGLRHGSYPFPWKGNDRLEPIIRRDFGKLLEHRDTILGNWMLYAMTVPLLTSGGFPRAVPIMTSLGQLLSLWDERTFKGWHQDGDAVVLSASGSMLSGIHGGWVYVPSANRVESFGPLSLKELLLSLVKEQQRSPASLPVRFGDFILEMEKRQDALEWPTPKPGDVKEADEFMDRLEREIGIYNKKRYKPR